MLVRQCKNLQESFYVGLKDILEQGIEVEVRGKKTKELHPYLFEISNPNQRVMLYPGRGNNPFASLAETVWVMAGKSNLYFLSFFLPRCYDYSDDGITWRAAYGPRLRRWDWPNGCDNDDQLEYVYNTLKEDPQSRQAVITIWAPHWDCSVGKSLDFPCSNYIQFLLRDKKLDMCVFMRSNDIFWGYSAINYFEFTTILNALAGALGVGTGTYWHWANSCHLYDQHWAKAGSLVSTYTPWPIDGVPCFSMNDLFVAGSWEKTNTGIDLMYQTCYDLVMEFNNFGFFCFHNLEALRNRVEQSHQIVGEIPVYLAIYMYWWLWKKGRIDTAVVLTESMRYFRMLEFTDLKCAAFYWIMKNLGEEISDDPVKIVKTMMDMRKETYVGLQ